MQLLAMMCATHEKLLVEPSFFLAEAQYTGVQWGVGGQLPLLLSIVSYHDALNLTVVTMVVLKHEPLEH